MSDGGKGSSPRPFSVSQEQFANNWDKIFGKKLSNNPDRDPVRGDQRINTMGQLEQFDEGYWQEIENRT